jgi:hypothetical protein
MDHLPHLLDRLLDQFLRLEWPLATQLQPGLSTETIEIQLQSLPFHLSQEVYTLYQWRNGDCTDYTDLFPLARFLPLEEAVTFYQEQIQLSQENEGDLDPADRLWKPGWFPVFQWDYKVYHVVLGQETPTATAPVLYYDPELNRTFRYASLTQLLQIVVECYETGAYFLKEAGDYRYLDQDPARVAAIQQKYLPEQGNDSTALSNEENPEHL